MRHPLFALLLVGLAGPVAASDPDLAQRQGGVTRATSGLNSGLEIADGYHFDSRNYQLDGFTRMTGWRLSQQWYFGRKRGEDPGLAFVWQRADDQMSISTGGIRFTRRF